MSGRPLQALSVGRVQVRLGLGLACLSGFFTVGSGSGNIHVGSSLQDMRSHVPHPPTPETKSSSACSLHGKAQGSSDSGKLGDLRMAHHMRCY